MPYMHLKRLYYAKRVIKSTGIWILWILQSYQPDKQYERMAVRWNISRDEFLPISDLFIKNAFSERDKKRPHRISQQRRASKEYDYLPAPYIVIPTYNFEITRKAIVS